MSGFIKRDKRTVNPAGGVNPASSPNVGQYGWTSYDANNVNQLIEYVNICKAYAEKAEGHADYIESVYQNITDVVDYVEDVLKQILPVINNLEAIQRDITKKHGEVTSMHKDVSDALVLSLQASTDAKQAATIAGSHANNAGISAAGADNSAVLAGKSEVGAKEWYDKSKELYDDLKEGQVYRGTWDPTTNAWPNPEGTNSVWDVSLPAGTGTHDFGGYTWRSGDRLLYVAATSAWDQLSTGSGVDSVNGKTGAVTITLDELGGLPSAGNPYIHGNLTVSGNLTVQGNEIEFANLNVLGDLSEKGHRVYSSGYKPTPADIGAVGLTGAQTMTGQLNGVKFTASDAYGFVSRLRGTQGLYLGNNANDRRTILGGGGEAVGDASGIVIVRPNGITDTAGEVTVTTDGNVSTSAVPLGAQHLTNKLYVDTAIKVVSDKVDAIPDTAGFMPKSGGNFTGPFGVKAATKSAMKVEDGASIRYNDGVGSWFHTFAHGNFLKWGGGNEGANELMNLGADGTLTVNGATYGRTGFIARDRAGTNWMALEAPENSAPYISSKTPAESGAVISMRFGQTEISAESGKRFAAGEMRVAANGGLKFAPTNDVSGITWGMGIDNSNRNLGIHKYDNGVWSAASLQITPANAVLMGALVVSGGSESTYHQVRNDGNPSLELHQPGNSAIMMYKPQNKSVVRFCQSNGAGGEALGYGEVSQYGFETANGRFSGTYISSDRSWSGVGQNHFHGYPSNVGGNGSLYGVVGKQVNYSGHWGLEQYYGIYVGDHAADNTAHVLASTDGGGYLRQWFFYNGGMLRGPSGDQGRAMELSGNGLSGTHANAVDWWRVTGSGSLEGSSYGGYGNIISWAVSSFAPASDERLKTVLGDSTKSALDIVDQFKFKKFAWKEDAGEAYTCRAKKVTDIGLIAQEVEAIDPNFTKDVKAGDSEVKALDTASLLALALKAIQEQQVEINKLKEKLNELV